MRGNRPQFRFFGFNEDWERLVAGMIFVTIADKNHADLPILSATQEFGMIRRDEANHDIFYDRNNEVTYKRVSPGQFVIHLRSFQGGFAHSNVEGITSPAYTVMDFKEKTKHNDYFWKYIFSSARFIKRLETVTYGIRDGRSINFSDFATLVFSYPSYVEQVKIGALLEHIDILIIQKQMRCERLQNLKAAMLEKMFPSDGADVPEIRFQGFTEPWEQRMFEDMVTRNSAMAVSSSELPSIEYEDIVSGQGILNKNIREKKIIKTGIQFEPGDVLFGKLRPYLRNWILSDFPGVAVGDFWVLHPSKTDSRYLYYLIQTPDFQATANQTTGTKMPRSDWNLVSNTKFHLPSDVTEQRKIGATFQTIDNLITFHQRELEKLRSIKKCMLERMFV